MANTSMIRADHAQIADWVEQFHRDGFLFLSDYLNAALAEHFYKDTNRDTNERLRVLLGFLPRGAYG